VTVQGPVALVAHSYGGAVISNVDSDAVYVNDFPPDAGESCFQLAGIFPGSTLGEATVQPVPRSDGNDRPLHRYGPIPRAQERGDARFVHQSMHYLQGAQT
jgi:hypothetical protein